MALNAQPGKDLIWRYRASQHPGQQQGGRKKTARALVRTAGAGPAAVTTPETVSKTVQKNPDLSLMKRFKAAVGDTAEQIGAEAVRIFFGPQSPLKRCFLASAHPHLLNHFMARAIGDEGEAQKALEAFYEDVDAQRRERKISWWKRRKIKPETVEKLVVEALAHVPDEPA